jgi:hypothetical protein
VPVSGTGEEEAHVDEEEAILSWAPFFLNFFRIVVIFLDCIIVNWDSN